MTHINKLIVVRKEDGFTVNTTVFAPVIRERSIRNEIFSLIGGFPLFWCLFCHFCDFPRSVIKLGGGVGIVPLGMGQGLPALDNFSATVFLFLLLDFNLIPDYTRWPPRSACWSATPTPPFF